MNAVEKLFHEEISFDLFQRVTRDRFSCVDSLIEEVDIDRYRENRRREMEAKKNGSND